MLFGPGSTGFLIAAAKNDRFPNFDALALSPTVGWCIAIAFMALVAIFMVHRETWSGIWLKKDDPRPMGLFRIVFGICAICNINGLWEYFEYLFTDEGIFFTDVAQQVRSKAQFAGFGDGLFPNEPYGFFDTYGFLEWLKGPNYSLLLFESSPQFFWAHIVVFEIAMVMLIVGWQTKWIKWVAWFLFHSIIMRNSLFWEGTENVYRVLFFYLCLSQCDRAYSVDNWLRCRKLRKQGLLSEPGKAGDGAGAAPSEEHPQGLQAIYRLIPSWPRMLVIVQIGALYLYTGTVKNGSVWHKGDAFYYMANLDHFYRLPPQGISAYLGTNFFRLCTWVTHYWEVFFSVVVLGLVLRWRKREQIPPLQGLRKKIALGSYLMLCAALITMVIVAYPVHYRPPKGGMSIRNVQIWVGVIASLSCIALAFIYRWLNNRPDDARINLMSVCSWLFGRRIWLAIGLMFHGHLIMLANIGWFTPGLVAGYICFLNGGELSHILADLRRLLHRAALLVGIRSKDEVKDFTPIPAEDPLLPHHPRDATQVPGSALATSFGIAVVGLIRHVQSVDDFWPKIADYIKKKSSVELPQELIDSPPPSYWGWFGLSILAFLVTLEVQRRRGREFRPIYGAVLILFCLVWSLLHEHTGLPISLMIPAVAGLSVLSTMQTVTDGPALTGRIPDTSPHSGRILPPWAYRPLGRILVSSLVAYHMTGVAIWLLPDKDSVKTFKWYARQPFNHWIKATQTTQSWGMFAPNPPRSNLFMRVIVTDTDGETYDMHTDLQSCFWSEGYDSDLCKSLYPQPWIWYSRRGKMNRRIVGSEGGNGSWYQKWHARWICRTWELEHEGQAPEKVEIIKVTYSVPTPEWVQSHGPYDPRRRFRKLNKQESVYKADCDRTINGQLPNFIRRRHGLPEVDPTKVKMWSKKRCKKWEERLYNEAKARGEEVEKDDPRFRRCSSEDAEQTELDNNSEEKTK